MRTVYKQHECRKSENQNIKLGFDLDLPLSSPAYMFGSRGISINT
jgi:hypothetical protein